ncbi:hypothetical protein GCM10008955_41580 [Deinococcus malanensis]|uniref:Uncharacterized protein n=2 Tax=Deinococcus malanensis TaxID=1706855 RepID=A0ABQ2F5L7_9DEIO|nr:hypothetical protein GCM10008955_41580 [Deinococcus malanensis]
MADMSRADATELTAVRAVIEAQIAVTTAQRYDLLPEIRTLRRLYKNAPVQPEALHQVRDAALEVLERLRAS